MTGFAMNNAIFITGTDTGVGKTVVTGLLGRVLAERGVKVITQKWVQTGCAGVSVDLAEHVRITGKGEEYFQKYRSDMAPYVLEFPASPHLAARLEKKVIDAGRIERSFRRLSEDFDFVLVEGSGGILVPLSEEEMTADLVERLRLPVLVVAENRLGAINQTLLTVEAVKSRGLWIAGILFNRLSEDGDEVILKDNLRIVARLTGEEVLGEIRYNEDADALYEGFLPLGERILEKLDGGCPGLSS